MGKQSSKRRRRVSFSDAPAPPKEPAAPAVDEIVPQKPANDPKDNDAPLADITGAAGVPAHSLLADGNARATGESVTPFDISEALEEGDRFDPSNDDGVIPASLMTAVNTEADDAASFTSEDDEPSAAASERTERDAWADAIDAAPPAPPVPPAPDADHATKRRKTGAPPARDVAVLSRATAVVRLVMLLHAAESPAQALARLKRERCAKDLELVTDLCQSLLGHGEFSTYELTREEVLHLVQWDLTWGRAPRVDAKCHGPLDAGMMGKWERARYFSQKGKTAWVRPHGARHVPWASAIEVFGSPVTH